VGIRVKNSYGSFPQSLREDEKGGEGAPYTPQGTKKKIEEGVGLTFRRAQTIRKEKKVKNRKHVSVLLACRGEKKGGAEEPLLERR